MLQKEAPAIKPARAQKVKVHKPGLRAPAAGSAPLAARAVDSRCLRLFSFFCQSCRCFLDHFSIVAALGPKPVPLICKSHGSIRWGAVRSKQRGWMWCMGTYVLSYSPSPSPLCRAGSRTTRPLRNPVPLLQRLAAGFATRTSTRAAVPRTHPMGTPR